MYKDPTEWRNGFKRWKETGESPWKAGKRLPRFEDGYEAFFNTLPENQKRGSYPTRRYWELNGKPKNFAEAIGRGMYTVLNDDGTLNWHAGSVAYNENADQYEFMKANYHPTRWMELVYGYDQSPEFLKEWKVLYNGPMLSDRYVRREKPGLKTKGGQLPRFVTGTEGELNMGPKLSTPDLEVVRKNTPHEQPVSNVDPIGEFVVKSVGLTKGAGIIGLFFKNLRLNRMKDTYRRMRSYDSDVENYTGKNRRASNIRFADEAARNLSGPDNPLYWLLDPIISGYTKLQSHPVIGPIIPF